MYIWHKETTPGTTGARCTIRDGSGLFVAECIASDAAAIVEAPAMLAALRKAQELLRDLEAPAHLDEGAALDDEMTAILARIDGELLNRVGNDLGRVCSLHRPTLHGVIGKPHDGAICIVAEPADVLGSMIEQRDRVSWLGRFEKRSDSDNP